MGATQDFYDRYGFDTTGHFIGTFDQKIGMMDNGTVCVPFSPRGLSGGPVWRLGDLSMQAPSSDEKLVAIATEFRRDALIGLRIGVVLSFARQIYPELHSELPLTDVIDSYMRVLRD